MARETSYFVLAFNAGRGGNLKADANRRKRRPVLRVRRDWLSSPVSSPFPEMGDYDDEPTVIFRKGESIGLRLRSRS
jgi:hypothetical protein